MEHKDRVEVTIGEHFVPETGSKISFSISYTGSNSNAKTAISTPTKPTIPTPTEATISTPIETATTTTTTPPPITQGLPCPYDHLVLVVHGVGSHDKNWQKTLKNINKQFNRMFYNVENENFDKRVKFVGTEWHSTIHTSLGQTIKDVTVKVGIPTVRALVDDTVMDFLMWSTPSFTEPINNEVTDQLNTEYNAFIKQFPNFTGKVSILAHSLGSIICYDILTNQALPTPTIVPNSVPNSEESLSFKDMFDYNNNISSNSSTTSSTHSNIPDESGADQSSSTGVNGNISLWKKIKDYEDDKKESFYTNVKFGELNFTVHNFYVIGSPIGALLALRKHTQIPIPKCDNFYNIINIHDPISFLVEPLIDKRFLNSEIQYLPRFNKKLNKLPKKFRSSKKIDKMIANTVSPNSSSVQSSPCMSTAQHQLQNISITPQNGSSLPPNLQPISAASSNSNEDSSSSDDEDDDDEDDDSGDTPTNSGISNSTSSNNVTQGWEEPQPKLQRNNALDNIALFGGYRYDFTMKPKFHISEFTSMLTAHSSYWLAKDVLNFVGLNLN